MFHLTANMLKPCCKHMHSGFFGHARPIAARQSSRRPTKKLLVHASLTNKGKRFSTDLVAVKKIMGEGSYGQVFEVWELRKCADKHLQALHSEMRCLGRSHWQRRTRTRCAEESQTARTGTDHCQHWCKALHCGHTYTLWLCRVQNRWDRWNTC